MRRKSTESGRIEKGKKRKERKTSILTFFKKSLVRPNNRLHLRWIETFTFERSPKWANLSWRSPK